MTIVESIEDFCSYFERQVATIGRIAIAPPTANADTEVGSEFRYRKVMYVTAIDTLAGLRFHKSAYPQLSRHNRERFTHFVKEHGSWPEGELVSLPFLKDDLQASKLHQRPLGQHVATKLAAFSTEDGGSLPASKIDEPLPELQARATTEEEEEAVAIISILHE